MQQRFIRGIRYVPTLPTVLAQILAMLNDNKSSAMDLEKIVTHDQALSSKVIAVANSAYYGFRHKILTVSRAVVALGYEEIRNICLGASLMGFLHPSTFKDRGSAEQLWLHALSVGEAARIVAELTRRAEAEHAFTGGLLHDLGKVVLAAFFPQEIDSLKDLMKREKLTYRAAEKALDIDHAQVGKSLAEHWDLPPQLGEIMGYHHDIHSGLAYYELVASVHVGDYLARSLELGNSGNPDPPEVKNLVMTRMGLNQEKMQAAAETLDSRRLAVSSLWHALVNS